MNKPLKAYCVWWGEWNGESAWVAAKSLGQARGLLVGFYDDDYDFIDYRPKREPRIDDVAAMQPVPTVMECDEGFGPIFRNRNLCSAECIAMGCPHGND